MKGKKIKLQIWDTAGMSNIQHFSKKNILDDKEKINSKLGCIFTSFKKEISILSHIAQKLQARHYLKKIRTIFCHKFYIF